MSETEYVAYVERDMEEIIPYFIEDSKAEIKGLVEALKAGDYQALKDFGHKIKGSSVTCSEGFREMSDIGLAIEEAAREKRGLKEIQGLVRRFVDYVNNLKVVYVDE